MREEKQRSDLIEILKLKTVVKIWEAFHGHMWCPCFPDLQVGNTDMSGVQKVHRQLLQGKEGSPCSGGLTRTDASDGCNALFGGNLKDTNSKDVLLVANIRTCGRNVQAASVTMIDVARLQVMPFASADEGGWSSMSFSEGQLGQTSVPYFRLDVLAYAIFPLVWNVFDPPLPIGTFPNEMHSGDLDGAERALSLEAMQCALVEGPQSTSQAIRCSFRLMVQSNGCSRCSQPLYLVNLMRRCHLNSCCSFMASSGHSSSIDRVQSGIAP